jgi:hypothetical protein
MANSYDNRIEQVEEQGCKHLHGNLFLVPFDMIRVPEGEDENEDGNYIFKNPRLMTENGQSVVLDKDLSSELRHSIKSQSMLNPLICRWVEGENDELIPQLVGGDRRYRALDYLIKKQEIVCDPRVCEIDDDGHYQYGTGPADEVYEFVACQVWNVNDDLDALSLSWAENKGRVNLNEGHEVAITIRLRECGASDEKILEILQRDEKWLANTDRLVEELDTTTLNDLIEGKLDRAAANELMSIKDPEVRSQVREKANLAAKEFADRKKKRIGKKMEAALDEKELAEAELVEAEILEDEDAIDDAEERIVEADKKAKRFAKDQKQVVAVTNTRQVKQAVSDVAGEDELVRCLSGRKIRIGLDYLEALIENEGKCLKGNFEADLDQLELLVRIIEGNILANDEDFEATIASFYE